MDNEGTHDMHHTLFLSRSAISQTPPIRKQMNTSNELWMTRVKPLFQRRKRRDIVSRCHARRRQTLMFKLSRHEWLCLKRFGETLPTRQPGTPPTAQRSFSRLLGVQPATTVVSTQLREASLRHQLELSRFMARRGSTVVGADYSSMDFSDDN